MRLIFFLKNDLLLFQKSELERQRDPKGETERDRDLPSTRSFTKGSQWPWMD